MHRLVLILLAGSAASCLAPNPGWGPDEDGGGTTTSSVGSASSQASTTNAETTDPQTTTNAQTTGNSVLPGECRVEKFDAPLSMERWTRWTDADSSLEVVDGELVFTPPSLGIDDTGINGKGVNVFPFSEASIRLRVVSPPPGDQSTLLFLQAFTRDTGAPTMVMTSDSINMRGTDASGLMLERTIEERPQWMGIRAQDGELIFEVSEDGITWRTELSASLPPSLEISPLIMAQTVGEVPMPVPIRIDDLQICN